MWKHMLRVAAITGIGIAAAVVADMVYPFDNDEEQPSLGNGEPKVNEANVIDVTPEA